MFRDLHIETERLIIRPFKLDDAPAFLELVNDQEVLRYIPLEHMSLEDVTRTFEQRIKSYEIDSLEDFDRASTAICLKGSGKLIGWVGLGRLEIDPSVIEVYYGLGRSYWGRGYATEAARAMLDYGFREWGLDRIVAIILPDNAASGRVLEKIGMKYEKQVTGLPEQHRFFEGVLYFALTREEYFSS